MHVQWTGKPEVIFEEENRKQAKWCSCMRRRACTGTCVCSNGYLFEGGGRVLKPTEYRSFENKQKKKKHWKLLTAPNSYLWLSRFPSSPPSPPPPPTGEPLCKCSFLGNPCKILFKLKLCEIKSQTIFFVITVNEVSSQWSNRVRISPIHPSPSCPALLTIRCDCWVCQSISNYGQCIY